MPKGLVNESSLNSIAEAINVLNGTNGEYYPSEMAPAILDAIPTEEVTDSIVSVTDAAAYPAEGLEFAIEPVQDLHGYDKPWPVGGQWNVFPNSLAETKTNNGITVVSDGFGKYTISGTATAQAEIPFDLVEPCVAPVSIGSGGHGCLYFFNSINDTSVEVRFINNGTPVDSWALAPVQRTHYEYSGLNGKTFNQIIICVASGVTVNGTVSPMFTDDDSITATFIPYSNICPISGWTGVNGERTGKNLFLAPYDVSKPTGYPSQWIGVSVVDGWIVQTGKPVGIGGFGGASTYNIKAGTYTISCEVDTSQCYNNSYSYNLWVLYKDGTKAIAAGPYYDVTANKLVNTFTLTKNAATLSLRVTSTGRDEASVCRYTNIQLELGNQATSYEPYQGEEISVEFPALGTNLLDVLQNNRIGTSGWTFSEGQVTATPISSGNGSFVWFNQEFSAGVYTISCIASGNGTSGARLLCSKQFPGGEWNSFYNAYYKDFDISNTFNSLSISMDEKFKVGLVFRSNPTSSENYGTFSDILLELGSTATSYEPYTNTVYGGNLNLTSGVLGVDRAKQSSFNAIEEMAGFSNISVFRFVKPNGIEQSLVDQTICDKLPAKTGQISDNVNSVYNLFTTYSTYYYHVALPLGTSLQDATDFINSLEIIYPLATPITYQLTPQQLQLFKLNNNIWADTGDTSVTYKVDLQSYIQKLIDAASGTT